MLYRLLILLCYFSGTFLVVFFYGIYDLWRSGEEVNIEKKKDLFRITHRTMRGIIKINQ